MRISQPEAVTLLQKGHVVAIPTETVWGLAASLFSETGVEKIFALKKRPSHNPLIIHVAKKEDCLPFIETVPPFFDELTRLFWPGPLTLVVPANCEKIMPQIRASLPTAAFRCPSHPDARALLQKTSPLVAPSANLSGRPSATLPEHIEDDFGKDFPVLDTQIQPCGLESTILVWDNSQWVLGRKGALEQEKLEAVLRYRLVSFTSEKIVCPGQHLRHYAPKAKLTLSNTPEGKTIIGFQERTYDGATKVFILGSLLNPEGVAQSLYKTLRQLDDEGVDAAAIDINFPQNGLWATIFERISRAASE